MKFQKKALIFVALLLMVAFMITACSSKPAEPTQQPKEESKPVEKKAIGLATASIGGAYYPMGQAMANVINKYVDTVNITPEVTNGAVENVRLIEKGQPQFGITNADIAYFGLNGKKPYETKMSISAIGNLHPSVFHIIVLDKSPIKSVSDLKGKKVAVGPAGGGTLNVLPVVLEEYGLKMSDLNASYLPFTDAFTQLGDGNLDAAFALGGSPLAAVTEIIATNKVRFLSIDDDKMENIAKEYPYFSKVTIPKDRYKLDTDATAIGVNNVFFCRQDADEKVVYDFAKAIYDHLDELKAANATAKQIDDANVGKTPIPLHPGAKKYFDEKK